MSDSPLMDVREVAGILDRTPTRIRQMIAANQLPAVKVAGRLKVPRKAFDLWLEQQNECALVAAGMGP